MPPEDSWDALSRELARLTVHDVEPGRAERIRRRAVAALAARRPRSHRIPDLLAQWLEPALAIGLSAAFLAAAIGHSLPFLP